MKLSAVEEKFILHWGEMGTKWGINRTVAQIHALLYLSARPLNAEEITRTLSVARSNVSNSLRELQAWGIVRVVHVLGDRRDHFETFEDVWHLFRTILEERKRREIDPTIAVLRACVAEAEQGGPKQAQTLERLSQMLEFVDSASSLYEQVSRMPRDMLIKFVRMGNKLPKALGIN
jgi:DNA-binding transcriptional regulator GbsR (MarR family)